MMLHHSCPRCHGTLVTDQDEFACLQCGARVYDLKGSEAAVDSKRPSIPIGSRAA